MNNKQSLILFIIIFVILAYILYRLPSVEKMSNIDVATENKIREIYKIDTDAIRNLSNLAKDLTVGGKLVVPGGLEIKGGLIVESGLKVKGELNVDDNVNLNKKLVVEKETLLKNNLKVNGFSEQLGGGSVEGKLYLRHTGANGSDDSDPYHLEKVRTSANNNHLRLTINDDANESFQIWGNSCGSEGGCAGLGRELLKLDGNGNLSILNSGTFGSAYVGSWPSGNRYAVFTHKNRKGLDYALLQGDYGTTYLNSNDRIYIRKNNNSNHGKLNVSLIQPANHFPWNASVFGAKMIEYGASPGDLMIGRRHNDSMTFLASLLENHRRIGFKGIWSGHEGGHGI